jgi:hypothetical protein
MGPREFEHPVCRFAIQIVCRSRRCRVNYVGKFAIGKTERADVALERLHSRVGELKPFRVARKDDSGDAAPGANQTFTQPRPDETSAAGQENALARERFPDSARVLDYVIEVAGWEHTSV